MRRPATVAEFESRLGLSWFFELTPLECQRLANLAGIPEYAHYAWDRLTPSLRLALAQAALDVCELAAKLAPDLER